MTTRFVKGKARTETPRLKDLPAGLVQDSARKPSEGRCRDGRFGPGNRAGLGQGVKALIRKGLGDPNDPATGELVREATRLYLATLKTMPSDGPAVRQLVAAQARHTAIATHYANEAAKAGFATPEGLRLAEAARSHDTTAQRLSVTAYDRAVHEAAAKPKADPFQDFYDRVDAAREGKAAALTAAPSEPDSGAAGGNP